MGTCTTRGCLRRPGGASIQKIPNNQNQIPRKANTAQKNSTLYNSNRATPCPVTINGICGHDAGITGHDQRNTQPSQIVPRLADGGQYVASESTFHRVLKAAHQLGHRSPERPRQKRSKPRALCTTAPNQLFSWDITYLPTRILGIYFYLYLFMDIFSRKIVGWQIYETESSDLAGEVMRDICARENIAPNQVVLHSDNGSPMKGATMLATLQELGVMPSFSRPAVSNDNPYSESLFRTLKYRPHYPNRAFENLLAARQWVDTFVHWYNHEHRHSAICFVTPHERHAGLDGALLGKRVDVYEAAKQRNPERWSGATRNWNPVRVVHLNPEHHVIEKSNHEERKHQLK